MGSKKEEKNSKKKKNHITLEWKKPHYNECESYNKFRNSFLKMTLLSPWQITFGHFFAKCAIFVRHHFLWVSYLSISGGVFVICHFCKVPLFSKSLKGCLFRCV